MKGPIPFPLGPGWSSLGFVRCEDGFGTFTTIADDRETARATLFFFTNGEIWTVDTYSLEATKREGNNVVPQIEPSFRKALTGYAELLMSVDAKPPFRWIAGMENLKGRDLHRPTPPGHMRVWPGADGRCLLDTVSEEGIYSPGDPPGQTLKPFFTKLYNACGAQRQDWQDA